MARAGTHAGLRENRQKVFDDFIAISEELIRTGVTTPQKLGAIGRSNGGLLMGVIMNQRPDLYAAIVNGVPLLDMQRYTRLGAGASWVAEYGDPDTADWDYMSKWSPYQNLRQGVAYPPVFYYTSTKDDRVHPAHARKAAARMKVAGPRLLLLREHRRRARRHGEPGPARVPHRAGVHLLCAAPDGCGSVKRKSGGQLDQCQRAASAAMYSGQVSQQPPIHVAPASTQRSLATTYCCGDRLCTAVASSVAWSAAFSQLFA